MMTRWQAGAPTSWMDQRIAALKAAGQFDAAGKAITQTGRVRTLTVHHGTGVAEPTADYFIDASGMDIERLFEEAGRVFGNKR